MIQGVRSVGLPRGEPIPCPQAWQNRAPAVTGAPHWSQDDVLRDAPQVEQNRPAPAAPQEAQVVTVALVITDIRIR
jgi:hypothetical protein